MTHGDMKRLLDMLNESHNEMRGTVQGVDLEIPAQEDGSWQIRDVLAHLAAWDQEVVKSIIAFKEGKEYSIPNFNEDAYNSKATLEMRGLTGQEVVEEWEQAREDFKAAIEDLSPQQFTGVMLYPWGDERGDITLLVKYMVEHDEEHLIEIREAAKRKEEG